MPLGIGTNPQFRNPAPLTFQCPEPSQQIPNPYTLKILKPIPRPYTPQQLAQEDLVVYEYFSEALTGQPSYTSAPRVDAGQECAPTGQQLWRPFPATTCLRFKV